MHLLASSSSSALLLLFTLTTSAAASASPYSAPLRLHLNPNNQTPSSSPLNLFRRQTYQCNPGTHACDNIGESLYCCNNDETCHRIDDIGYGSVACCASGSTCSGNLSGCGSDKISCLKNVGGGCCNQGSMCTKYGCIVDPALGAKFSSDVAAPSGAGIGAAGTAARTVTVQTTTPTTTTTMVGETSLCDDGWRACAAAAGGGCCPDGYQCGIRSCPGSLTVVTETVNGILVMATAQLPAVTKRSQNIFVPVTGDASGMWEEGRAWMAVVVAVGLAVGGALV